MSAKQPEALRLANLIRSRYGNDINDEAAAELRRLHAVEEELLDAADNALNVLIACCVPAGGVDDRKAILEAQHMLRVAIAKAKEQA